MQPVKRRRIGVYVKPGGASPFRAWIRGLKDLLGISVVYNRLDRLADGNPGDCKRLDRIYEMRLHHGPGYRIYFGQDGPLLVVLLVGGDKSSQVKDIKLAEKYWNDYQTRKAEALDIL